MNNDDIDIPKLVAFLPSSVQLIVMEATGKYEQRLLVALIEAGLPAVAINLAKHAISPRPQACWRRPMLSGCQGIVLVCRASSSQKCVLFLT
ncbi:MAG: hypothetical protein U0165_20985 [Polyangiaceae bacterium]